MDALIHGNYRPWPLRRSELDMIHDISSSLLVMVKTLLADGLTNSQTAKEMNARGYKHPQSGRKWTPMSVKAYARKEVDTVSVSKPRLGPVLGPKTRKNTLRMLKRRSSTPGTSWMRSGMVEGFSVSFSKDEND